MRIQLPEPIPAQLTYDQVQAENIRYDPMQSKFIARVYGVSGEAVMPLILLRGGAVHRIEEVEITDDEIDALLAGAPEARLTRVAAAMQVALNRLYQLSAQEP